MAKQPKRLKAWTGDRDAAHSVEAAIALVKANAKAKFDESIEISVNLGVDPRHADQQVRGVVNLPSGTGRDVRVAVFPRTPRRPKPPRRAPSTSALTTCTKRSPAASWTSIASSRPRT